MIDRALYVAACILAPLAWGLVTWAVTQAIEKRRPPKPPAPGPGKSDPPMPDLEYYL